jgi:hypothetical protein
MTSGQCEQPPSASRRELLIRPPVEAIPNGFTEFEMQWLLKFETDRDPIVICRLMNIFRRKGVAIETMALTAGVEGFSGVAVVGTPAAEIDHVFNFLRRTDGVRDVTCYQHEPSSAGSFVFFEADCDQERVRRILEVLPECKIVFAGQGKFLLETPPENHCGARMAGLGESGFLSFAPVKTGRGNLLGQVASVVSS